MGRLDRTVTAIALSAYLAATFLPCEAPEGIGLFTSSFAGSAGPRAHAEPAAVATAPAAEKSHVHGGPSSHAGNGDHAGQAGQIGHAGHGSGHTPDPTHHAHRVADEPKPAAVHADVQARSTPLLVFTAPCLCGCAETRSTVGGGAARLGSAIAEVSMARWVALASPRVPVSSPARFPSPGRVIDPIPI